MSRKEHEMPNQRVTTWAMFKRLTSLGGYFTKPFLKRKTFFVDVFTCEQHIAIFADITTENFLPSLTYQFSSCSIQVDFKNINTLLKVVISEIVGSVGV